MKIFGSTQYVKVEGQYKDVEPGEKYLQLSVKNQWDWSNDKFTVYRNGFSYYVDIKSKDLDGSYSSFAQFSKEDITGEFLRALDIKYIE